MLKETNMPRVRRIERFALPFLAGTLLTMTLPPSLRCGTAVPVSAILLLSLMIFGCMMMSRKYGTGNMPSCPLILSIMLCAAVCVLRSEATAVTGGDAILFSGDVQNPLLKLCEKFKNLIDSLPLEDRENNALLKALLTGDRSELSAKTSQAFRDSGAAHILALSGLHLGIIYGIVTKCFAILGNSPAAVKTRSALTIAATGAYCLMVGAGPSISRAFLFILLRECSVILGRSASLRDTLCGAFVIQVCLDAEAVRSVSFQLSYLAIAGIAYIYPILRDFWPSDGARRSPLRWIWNSAAVSIACQTTTGPLAWLRFGTFPKYFILTNLISLPLTGLLIPAALLTVLLHALGICPPAAAYATEFLADTLRRCLGIIASI